MTRNGGTCNYSCGKYTCDCTPGYTGTTCASDVNGCSSVTCQNGGKCVDGLNSYTCLCEQGFDGRHCENGACPVLPDIPHGHVDMSSGRHVGSIAMYSCNNNYALVGLSVRSCETNGMWKGAIPECVYVFTTGLVWVALGEFGLLIVATSAFCIWKRHRKFCLNKPSTKIAGVNIRKSNAYDCLNEGEASGTQEYVSMSHVGTERARGQVDTALSNI
ncbi:hypothetical protein DPMN_013454 [Dreissena polymorpha]|uniref:Uncharacterized protein n=1 Tax=Dreissena polymorpha TaxID=45954 RepID=A0A9D4N5H4_DREPO|nr:hypothetical protein DPMN_013454 [Dreissena polymorpha]